jgi:hypothetical protein
MHYRFIAATILCFCLALSASAQQLFTVKGIIFRKNTPITVSQAVVSNLSRKNIAATMSDDLGDFHIQAEMGDTLLFKKTDYAVQTMVVQSHVDLSVYLQPVIHLNEVNIKDISKAREMSNVLDDYKKKGQYYTLKPSALSMATSPLTGLYELFGKGSAEARKFRQYSIDEQERTAVRKRYTKKLVQQVTNMPENEVADFMLAFTPSYEDIKGWNDYDIINYIKRSFGYFQNNKNSLKIQKLY